MSEALPLGVQPALSTPGDVDHTRVLTMLTACDRGADGGLVAIVVGGASTSNLRACVGPAFVIAP